MKSENRTLLGFSLKWGSPCFQLPLKRTHSAYVNMFKRLGLCKNIESHTHTQTWNYLNYNLHSKNYVIWLWTYSGVLVSPISYFGESHCGLLLKHNDESSSFVSQITFCTCGAAESLWTVSKLNWSSQHAQIERRYNEEISFSLKCEAFWDGKPVVDKILPTWHKEVT
jgi:hypothetical protein